jgi:AraC family transcriptional regulator
VHARFREHLRIDEIAHAAGVHPAHLAAVFRRVHRMPLGSYVRRLRVDWAADRLIGTNNPISAIAAEAGFADQAHLTRWFRRVTGVTPAAYRRAHLR